MRKLLFYFGLVGLIFSCKNEQPTIKTLPSTPPKEEIESVIPKHYLHLTGTIKNLPITMDLNFHTPPNHGQGNKKGYFFGSYYYDKYQEPIELWQSKDSAGVLILTEKYAYDEDNKFVGTFDGQTFSGKWFDGYRQFSFPFSLTVAKDNAVAFDYSSYSEVFKLTPDSLDSPLAEYALSALWPKAGGDSTVTSFLEERIIDILIADSIAPKASSPEAYFNIAKDNYFQKYQADMKAEGDDFSAVNYGRDLDMSIVWNTDDLLSLGAMHYEYLGGAHGNYGTIYHVFDLENLKVLTEKEIFKPNVEKKIAKALMNSAERTFDSDMIDYTPIDAISQQAVKPNGNFFVTGGGIGYNFVPYEIAPYALGEIQLFLPKGEIMDLLQPAFVKRMGW